MMSKGTLVCVDQNFILKQIGEKAQEKTECIHEFYRFGEGV